MLTFRSLLVPFALLVGSLVAVIGGPVAAVDGGARVIDGDTFDLGGERIRLYGIDAPELSQGCERGGTSWRCGAWSARVLAGLLAEGAVSCRTRDHDRYGRSVALCSVAGRDLGAAMVQAGAATAYARYSKRYLADQTAARRAGLGIWAGQMQAPEDFRHPAEPTPACKIKGNIGTSGKIYHMPGQRDYAATRISPARGEAWFCTEAQARAAGFRRARR